MKAFALSLASAATLLTSTPALAQFCDNANCARAVQRQYDPAYRAAAIRGYSYAYGYGYQPMAGYGQQDTTCVLGLFCSSRSGRNHAGDVCYDATGIAYGLDKGMHWYRLSSAPDPMQANDRHVRCGFTGEYSASAPAPAPATVVVQSPGTYRDGDYLVTVSVDSAGDQVITRHYQPER